MPSNPVDWELAERVAIRSASHEPFSHSYLGHSLQQDFDEATEEAEELVAATTGLRSLSGPARARVTDRAGWVHANVNSFQRLLRPLTERLGDRMGDTFASSVTRKVGGLEVGLLLGWMSARVLGQYDLLVVDDPAETSPDDQDLVYYVGPNVLALEKRFAFPPREFRLWLALHEVTHRAQFTGVPWLREHYLGLVHETLDSVDPDPKRFLDALTKVVDELRQGRKPLDDGGLASLLATPSQRVVLDKIGGLMSLLEGHGDVTMDRAGADRIPSAHRFSRVLRERRANAKPAAKVVQRLLGIEAKINQYARGESFIAEVERLGGGPDALEPVWRGASWLPTLAEIRDPAEWLDRVRLSDELVALARLERQTAGQEPPPDPLVRLSRLEQPRPPLARAAVVTADPASSLDVDLTPKQRELLGALLVAPSASAAAATLGMSRSNVYAGLRRIARNAGITDVSDLLRLLRAGRLASALEP